MSDSKAFTRPEVYLAWAISGAVIAGVLGAGAKRAAAMGAVAWGLQNVLRSSNFEGRAEVVQQAARAVEAGEAAPEVVLIPDALAGEVPAYVRPALTIPEPLVLPTTIHVPKPKAPLPPYSPPSVGNLPYFEEAAADIISRAPVVIQDPLKRTAEAVGRLYREDHVFALAKSTDLAVTKRVQAIVEEGIVQGLSEEQAIAKIMAVNADWTRGYAQTVYRTNLATAQVEGRFQQAARPGMDRILPLMVFQTVGDNRVRPNHRAADGAAAAPDHFMWDIIRPPLGYNCRCRVVLASWEMARRMGLVNPDGTIGSRAPQHGAGTDPGFVHSGRSRWMP